jgi:alkylated DNA repair protein (DNA oxidative demethylase)
MLFPNDSVTELADGAVVLHGVAEAVATELVRLIDEVVRVSPLRTVMTPMGKPMSVEMTNCGAAGWMSDRSGYRYETIDPLTDRPWPAMPGTFRKFASEIADRAGYQAFDPDVCLVNRYAVGSKMGLHQDRDERDFSQPIVSVSLGLPITFKFGGVQRTDRTTSVKLQHGDVVVFGGASRLAFHGVGILRRGHHELTGGYRFNLTFRSL